jgi:uncharacterized protein YdeI (YjbR/CyaY-like superfamily)
MDELPLDLIEALRGANLMVFFADCTAPHRREYLKWIAEAKRQETRVVRIRKTIRMLVAKQAQEDGRTRKKS